MTTKQTEILAAESRLESLRNAAQRSQERLWSIESDIQAIKDEIQRLKAQS
jgi:predicted  nucleic acid-binding Zn-ribbon protein